MSKTLIIVFLITIIFTLGVVNLAWAKYKCECTSGDEIKIYSTKEECEDSGENGCEAFCSERGGFKSCIKIEDKKKTEEKPESANLDNPLGETSIAKIVGRIIKAFLGIIGTISLVMFIYAGLMLLTAAGNSSQIQKGQQTMVWASLGILVVFASYAILKFVFSAFGL
mgnify:CR=1 FL=1